MGHKFQHAYLPSFPRNFVSQIFEGKTIARIIFNEKIASNCLELSGKVLDLASGGHSDYKQYLPDDIELIRTDSVMKDGVETRVDFNMELPFFNNEFDAVLFFNALYIAENRVATLREVFRIIKPGGCLYLSMPLLYGEIPEPVDYCRLTFQGIEKELKEAGFVKINIIRYGERFTAAALLLHPFFMFNVVRYVVYSFSLFLDGMIPLGFRSSHPAPLGYFCIIRK